MTEKKHNHLKKENIKILFKHDYLPKLWHQKSAEVQLLTYLKKS